MLLVKTVYFLFLCKFAVINIIKNFVISQVPNFHLAFRYKAIYEIFCLIQRFKEGRFYRGRCKYKREQEVNLSYKLGEGIFREEATCK